ncbi:hypothetical protein HMSSN036_48960 [Paenibacillus macerans]|nr:hypothetical protein HMSSN036_48960 [Paenibacillus macerans]
MSEGEQLCEELIIVGYSFRDEHINSAISNRIKLASLCSDLRPLRLLIIDYAKSDKDKEAFVNQVNLALGLGEDAAERFIKNDPRISFEGANSVLHHYI